MLEYSIIDFITVASFLIDNFDGDVNDLDDYDDRDDDDSAHNDYAYSAYVWVDGRPICDFYLQKYRPKPKLL